MTREELKAAAVTMLDRAYCPYSHFAVGAALECADGTLYCGITTDLARRLDQHNGLAPGGARYTSGRRPVRLLASRACAHKGAALRLECAVKARPRAEKILFLQEGVVAPC